MAHYLQFHQKWHLIQYKILYSEPLPYPVKWDYRHHYLPHLIKQHLLNVNSISMNNDLNTFTIE